MLVTLFEMVATGGATCILPRVDISFFFEQTLSEGDIQESATINLGERLLGGKVHGSLARAGKVKGQTPKVDPQEKKKPKTGRAKRRNQYNNRFVNVVVTMGRKKGPNSNEK